ncbi:conserved domain protein [Ruminococcus albus 8]|uniref:Conserved domain protein n=1 Tax=Ruminococcus albus 8 TaxID=246199 RepID=E9SG63_RUMAL|nr:conserved domain protein [Ruminococcus albus 8]
MLYGYYSGRFFGISKTKSCFIGSCQKLLERFGIAKFGFHDSAHKKMITALSNMTGKG